MRQGVSCHLRIIYDLAMPYEANGDFLEVIRLLPGLVGIPFVITTNNKVGSNRWWDRRRRCRSSASRPTSTNGCTLSTPPAAFQAIRSHRSGGAHLPLHWPQ